MASTEVRDTKTIDTDIPARMDRLPWARWHWTILIGLGTVWILDGLEVTIVGALGERLTDPTSGLHLTEGQVGLAASFYVIGAVLGSLVFGYLTDRIGRKRLFLVTLTLYLIATVLTAFSFSPWWFFLMRFATGAGVGGEYAAINSAIDELVPARVRGRIDLIVNGSYWLGAAVGAALTLVLLNPALFAIDFGWRLAFGLGAILGVGILIVRRNVPESPRWLFTHGRVAEADSLVRDIEHTVSEQTEKQLESVTDTITVRQRGSVGFGEIGRTLIRTYPRRTTLGLALFIGQAFLYNAVYFTQALVLGKFFQVSGAISGAYLIPLAIGSLLGPVVLGRLFDTIGRRVMISISYLGSGLLLVGTGLLFQHGMLSATTLTVAWSMVFFLASAGASAAYLTVSEIFPLEIRAMAIALFYSVGTGLGGIIGPALFGQLVGTGSPDLVSIGYYLGAGVMIFGGIIEIWLGVEAAQRTLEDIASPLSSVETDKKPAQQRAAGGNARISSRAATASGFAPMPGISDYPDTRFGDRTRNSEIDSIVAALEQRPLSRAELRQRVDARSWGPGRFADALRHAVATGQIDQDNRNRYRRAQQT